MSWQTTAWSPVPSFDPSAPNFYLVVGLLLVIVALCIFIVLQHLRYRQKTFHFRIIGDQSSSPTEDESADASDELIAGRSWINESDDLVSYRPRPDLSLEPIPGQHEYVNDLLFPPLEERQQIWNSLSPRLREAAALAATGKRNAEIARELSISKRTVESHLGLTYDKLGIRSRTQLSVWLRDIVL